MKFLFTAIAITATSGGCATTATTDLAALRSEFEAAAPAWLEAHSVPGVAVAFIQDAEVAWTAAAGRRDGDQPATIDTVWNVASLAKPATAQVIIELTGRGVIDLDTPMSHAYVDADLSQDARLEALTPRVALLHQTGFANWRRETGGVLQFQFTPGTQTRYSGEGYTYLARYAQAVTGVPFPDLADDLVFSPLGMGDTDFRAPSTLAPSANAHNEQGEPIGRARGDWSGADDLSTTVADYASLMLHAADTSALPRRSPRTATGSWTISWPADARFPRLTARPRWALVWVGRFLNMARHRSSSTGAPIAGSEPLHSMTRTRELAR